MRQPDYWGIVKAAEAGQIIVAAQIRLLAELIDELKRRLQAAEMPLLGRTH